MLVYIKCYRGDEFCISWGPNKETQQTNCKQLMLPVFAFVNRCAVLEDGNNYLPMRVQISGLIRKGNKWWPYQFIFTVVDSRIHNRLLSVDEKG